MKSFISFYGKTNSLDAKAFGVYGQKRYESLIYLKQIQGIIYRFSYSFTYSASH